MTELTLHVDTLRQRPGVRSLTMVVLQALHLPGLDVDGGVLQLLQTSGGVLDLEYFTQALLPCETKSYVTDNLLDLKIHLPNY